MIKIKPVNDTIGPTVIRRVLKMSGLNSVPVVEPVINAKPNTIIANPTAINIILILPNVNRVLFSINFNITPNSSREIREVSIDCVKYL